MPCDDEWLSPKLCPVHGSQRGVALPAYQSVEHALMALQHEINNEIVPAAAVPWQLPAGPGQQAGRACGVHSRLIQATWHVHMQSDMHGLQGLPLQKPVRPVKGGVAAAGCLLGVCCLHRCPCTGCQ